MVRDPRGSAYSQIRRWEKNLTDQPLTERFINMIEKWDRRNRIGYTACQQLGPHKCLIVKYEQLVVSPKPVIMNLLEFLELEFNESYLNHKDFFGTEIKYDKNLKDANEAAINLKKDIFTNSLKLWVGKVNYDKKYVNQTIKMLHVFGYEVNFDDSNDGKEIT